MNGPRHAIRRHKPATAGHYTAAAMKLLFDFLPILLFFGAFKYAEGQKDWAAAFATEHLGFILAEMQFLQRAYPGAQW